MSKTNSFKLNAILPYFQDVKEYFGITYNFIVGSLKIVESDPDAEQWVQIPEKIEPSILENLFDTWHFNIG